MLKKIWHDPVWSKVISGAILAAAAGVSKWLNFNVPGWLTVVLVGGGIVAGLAASLAERNQGSAVRPIPSRKDYVGETIDRIKRSSNSVLMCVHTLEPADQTGAVRQMHDALAAKAGLPNHVKLLAPGGERRVRASAQLAKLGVPIRHIDDLAHMDMSFSVFDSSRAVLPTNSGASKQTVAGVTVESAKLADMLKVLFADLWSRFDALCPFGEGAQSVISVGNRSAENPAHGGPSDLQAASDLRFTVSVS